MAHHDALLPTTASTSSSIALGYKGEYIKRWMREFATLHSNMTVKTGTGDVTLHDKDRQDWTVDLVDTGQDTATGGRIKRLKPWMGDGTFMLTWGDGVSDVDLDAAAGLPPLPRQAGHPDRGAAPRPASVTSSSRATASPSFTEKPQTSEGWINGAFFVLEPGVFDYIEGDDTQWEQEPLERLARDGQLMAYRHESFWQCMDTLRDKKLLREALGRWLRPLEHLGLGHGHRQPRDLTMRVLVTGHQGYIGTVLVPLLLERGHEVAGLDTDYFRRLHLRRRPSGSRSRSCRRISGTSRPGDVAGLRRRHPPGRRCPTTRWATTSPA